MASALHPVVPAMKASAMSQARSGSAWWHMVPKKPHSGCSPDATRAFLDSRYGRHFADEVSNHLAAGNALASAINAATATWMGWRISSRTAHETGIPRGLPYLTGYVLHAEIEADIAD